MYQKGELDRPNRPNGNQDGVDSLDDVGKI
jgi:hypothetical protein